MFRSKGVPDGVLPVTPRAPMFHPRRPRVRVHLLDWRAIEADVRGIRQGILKVAGEAVGHHLLAVIDLEVTRFRPSIPSMKVTE